MRADEVARKTCFWTMPFEAYMIHIR